MDPLAEADPRRIGPYVILGRLGAGGMGTVFAGRSLSGRAVAVKTVHAHLAADPDFRERFAREVAAARRVNGFYTADVVDADADAEVPWMATRFIDGPSLTQRVRDGGPLPAREVLVLAAGIAEALASIHAEGLVHRDLKPSNVILSAAGPQVIDFGIARLAEGGTLTRAGGLVGTFEYMSPEQSADEAVASASDVFSLGGLLHFAATGRPAFGTGQPAELLHRIHFTEPDLSGLTDGRLHDLVAACLARSPADRPDPARIIELASAALAASDGPVPADGRSAPDDEASRPGPRRRTLLVAVVAVAGAGAGTVAAVRLMPGSGTRTAPRATRTIDAHHSDVLQVAFAPDGTTFATAETTRTIRIWDTATGARLREFAPSDLRVMAIAWSPDGSTLAVVCQDRVVRLCDPVSGTVRQALTGHTDWVAAVAFSPDGRTLATAGYDSTLRTWDTSTGASPYTVTGHSDWVTAVRYADAATLATGSLDGTVQVRRADTGALIRTLAVGIPVYTLAAAPSGGALAVAGAAGPVQLWSPVTAGRVRTLTGHTGAVYAVAYAPDGATLATASADGTARLWTVASGVPRQVLRDGAGPVTAVAFSRDGTLLATAAGGAVRIRAAATGEVVTTRPPARGAASAVAFAPDGSTVATGGGDGLVKVWGTADGALRRTFTGHTAYVNDVTFAPDGRTIASCAEDGTARLWDVATGRLLRTMVRLRTDGVLGTPASPQDNVYELAFAPDGRTLATCGVGGSALRLWRPADGSLLHGVDNVAQGTAACLGMAPDGTAVATGHQKGAVRIWAVADGHALRVLEGHEGWVLTVGYAPDGRSLASAGDDGSVRIWDAATGDLRHALTGHAASVITLAHAPDGATLASGDSRGEVRIWDAAGTVRDVLTGHAGRVTGLAWTPDGRILASTGVDGTLRFWAVPAGRSSTAVAAPPTREARRGSAH